MVTQTSPDDDVRHHISDNEQVERETPDSADGVDTPPRCPNPSLVQRLLEKEGHDARNVVSWLVPNRTSGGGCGSLVFDSRTAGYMAPRGQRGDREGQEASRERELSRRKGSPITSPFKGSSSSLSSKGTSSLRGRSGSDSTAHGFNQRLWGYLFRNVNRAVDELYYLCEAESSATHCTEAAELLEGCSRDFTKLVERVAVQTRFEEEQRAARAAERTCPEGETGGDLSAESGGRKPKGLVWEVRKTTSASTASAMVLTAIERMESHHAGERDASSRASLKFRSPENVTTGSCGGGRGNGITASTSTLKRERDEQQPAPSGKSPEELSRYSSGDAGAGVAFRDIRGNAETDGEPASACQSEPIERDEGRVEGGLSGAVTLAPVCKGSDENSGTRREDLSSGSCASVAQGLLGAADPADGNIKRPDAHGPDGRSVGNRPQEGEKGAERVQAGREDEAESRVDENRLGSGCGIALTGSTSSTIATVAEVDDREAQKGSSEEQRIFLDAATATEAMIDSSDHEERNAADSRTSTSTGAPKGDHFARGNTGKETEKGLPTASDVSQTRPNGSRLNPRATPFTFHPGASAFPATSRATPGREGETRHPKSVELKVPPKVAKGAATPPHRVPASTVSSSATAAVGVASGTPNTKVDAGGEKIDGGCLAPRAEHDLLPSPPSPSKASRDGVVNGSELPPPDTFGGDVSRSNKDVGVEAARAAAGVASEESKHASSPSTNGEASGTVCEGEVTGSREAKGKHASDGVSAAPAFLPPESKWSRRPNLTPDGPVGNRATSSVPAGKLPLPASHRGPQKITPPRDTRFPGPPTRRGSGRCDGAVSAGGMGGVRLSLTAKRSQSPKAKEALIGAQDRMASVPAAPARGDRRRPDERSPSVEANGAGDYGGGMDTRGSAGRSTDPRATSASLVQRPEQRIHAMEDASGGGMSLPEGENGGDDGGATETDCEDPDSAYVIEMERIWAEAEAWVDAEAQAEEEAWARLPKEVPCPSESEEVTSDMEEACRSGCAIESSAGRSGGGREIESRGDTLAEPYHSELEIEIPVPVPVPGEEGVEGRGSFSGEGRRIGEDDRHRRVDGLGLEDAERGSSPWFYPRGDPGLDPFDEDFDEDREEDEKESGTRGGESPGCSCLQSPVSPAGFPLGRSGNQNVTHSESSSGASCFGNDRGGSREAIDEGCTSLSRRELQKKLSSPQRKPQRKLLSAAEAKLRQERRQMVAELNRAQLASGMAEKLKQQEERARGVRFRKEEQLLRAEEEARRKMEGADARRREHRRGIVRKANDANSKVKEVLFMNKLTVEDLKITLQMQLAEVDRKIQSGRARRQRLLAGISDRQKKRTKDKAAQMSERRLEAEEAAAMRWEALQKRLEAVQERRRDRERETSRRMQAADRHKQARERREAMLKQLDGARRQLHDWGEQRDEKSSRRRQPPGTDKQPPEDRGSQRRSATMRDARRSGEESSRALETKQHQDKASTIEQSNRAPLASGSISCGNTHFGGPSDGGGGDDLDASVFKENALPFPSSFQPPVPAAAGEKAGLAMGVGQKRGRAQKKRAKKIKDKIRELCLEAAATAPATANVGAEIASASLTGSIAPTQLGPRISFGVSGSDSRGIADFSSGNLRVGNHRGDRRKSGTPGPTLCPRLTRAATDLVALARARAPCQRCCKTPAFLSEREECSEVGTNFASETASSSSNAEDTVATAVKAVGDATAAAAATPTALSPPSPRSPELLQKEHACENGTTFAAEETAISAAANGEAGGSLQELCSVNPSDADRLPPPSTLCEKGNIEGNSALASVALEGRGTHEQQHQQRVEEVPVLGNNSRDGELESTAISDDGPLGDKNAAPRHKKTRRGKRAGGASNRRRGPKTKGKVRSGETPATANVADRVDREEEGTIAPPVSPLRDVGIRTHEEGPDASAEGEIVDRNSSGDIASCRGGREIRGGGRYGIHRDGACSCTSCSVDIAALECAALRSLRDLRSMFASPMTARGQTGTDSLVESRLQSCGVFESLVVLCAPYPWAPIPLLRDTLPGGLPFRTCETPERIGGQEARRGAENAVDTPSRSVATCSSKMLAEGVHVDDGVCTEKSRNGVTVATCAMAAFGGLHGAGGREAVTEGALGFLSTALEESKNRDYVLRIDGATPLVDCLARLLERMTRPGNNAPKSSSAAHLLENSEPNARDSKVGTALDKNTRKNGRRGARVNAGSKKQTYSPASAYVATAGNGDCVQINNVSADMKAFDGRVAGVSGGVEEALLKALAVVTLLLRHEVSDETCSRIQDELVRYFVAKRLLSELAVIVRQLHPYCDSIIDSSRKERKAPATTGKSKKPRPTSSPLILRLKTHSEPDAWALSLTPSSRQALPLARLLAPIAELVDVVLSYPLRGMAKPRPNQPQTTKISVNGEPSTLARNFPPVGKGRPSSVSANASIPPNKRVAPGESVGSCSASSGGDGNIGERKNDSRERLKVVCKSMEDIREGRATAWPEFCGVLRGAPGAMRVVVELVSLLAAMAGTGGSTRREFERDGASPGARDTLALSDALLRLASIVVRAANRVCLIDLGLMQESLSAEGVQQEFTFLCDRLLGSLIEKVESQGVTSPDPRPMEAEESLQEVVYLLGYFALGNRKHQEMLQWGSPPTILVRLCNLPFRYFMEPMLQAVLFPTLISICHENVRNRDVAENDLAGELLASFLEDNLRAYRDCLPSVEQHDPGARKAEAGAVDSSWLRLSTRLPLDLWEPAIRFLSDPEKQ